MTAVLSALASVGAVLAVGFGFAVLGAALAGPGRLAAADIVIGWALAAGLLTAAGVAPWIGIPLLRPAAVGLLGTALAAGGMIARCRRPVGTRAGWAALALAVPWMLAAALAPAAEWDDFSHWLPNLAYLDRYDRFPAQGLPPGISQWPGYPYALPLWAWLGSRVAGGFREAAPALANITLLVTFGAVLIDPGPGPSGPGWRRVWGRAGLAVLVVTAFNPGYVKGFVDTGYADGATAVCTGVMGLAGWRLIEALRIGAARPLARAPAIQAGLAGLALVLLKQANPVLVALVAAGLGLVVLVDPAVPRRRFLTWLPLLVMPAGLGLMLWHGYVATALPGGAFGFLPSAAWRFDRIGSILAAAGGIAAQKSGHFGLMAGVVALGVAGLRRPTTPLRRLAIIAATVFVGYTGFLLFTYVAAANFTDAEIARVASFWRYSLHAGLLGLAVAVTGAAGLWPRLPAWFRTFAETPMAALILAALILAAPLALTSQLVNRPSARIAAARAAARDLADTLPAGAAVAVIAPGDDGLIQRVVAFELWRPGRDDRGLRLVGLADLGNRPSPFVLALGPDPALAGLIDPPPPTPALLSWNAGRWRATSLHPTGVQAAVINN